MFVYMYVTAATGRQPNCSKQINNDNNNNNNNNMHTYIHTYLHAYRKPTIKLWLKFGEEFLYNAVRNYVHHITEQTSLID